MLHRVSRLRQAGAPSCRRATMPLDQDPAQRAREQQRMRPRHRRARRTASRSRRTRPVAPGRPDHRTSAPPGPVAAARYATMMPHWQRPARRPLPRPRTIATTCARDTTAASHRADGLPATPATRTGSPVRYWSGWRTGCVGANWRMPPPEDVVLTSGSHAALAPEVLHQPDQATEWWLPAATRSRSPCAHPVATTPRTTVSAAHTSDANQGKVAGQGPIATGHSQGKVKKATTTDTFRTPIRIQSGQGIAAIKGSDLLWFSHANLTARHCCSETMPHIWRNAKAASAGRWFNASAAASF